MISHRQVVDFLTRLQVDPDWEGHLVARVLAQRVVVYVWPDATFLEPTYELIQVKNFWCFAREVAAIDEVVVATVVVTCPEGFLLRRLSGASAPQDLRSFQEILLSIEREGRFSEWVCCEVQGESGGIKGTVRFIVEAQASAGAISDECRVSIDLVREA